MHLLGQHGRLTRGQLAEETGLTSAAISRISREMLEAGVLIEIGTDKPLGRAGRRETWLSINPAGAFVLAISLTANRRSIALANALGDTIATLDCDDLDPSNSERFMDALISRAKVLTYDADFNRSRLLGVGVSAAISGEAQAAYDLGLVTSAPLGWQDVPVRETLSQALCLPVKVEPRASAILRAELKSQPESSNIYLVNVALGIGVSARLGGRFMAPGSEGFGSLSHFRLPGDEAPCPCGRRGCFEVAAAGGAIASSLENSGKSLGELSQSLNSVVISANAGDEATVQVFREAGRRLGVGLDAVLSLFDLSKIILSGEVGRQQDYYSGIIETLEAAGRSDACALVQRSTITSAEAAISVALQEYVMTGNLNLKKLKAA